MNLLKPARQYWLTRMHRMALPVVQAAAAGRLHDAIPLHAAPDCAPEARRPYAALEAFGRTMAGIAPWLECQGGSVNELMMRQEMLPLVHRAFEVGLAEDGPGRLNFDDGYQPLVDAAFLAHALIRAPRALIGRMSQPVRHATIRRLQSLRTRQPANCNWLLFAAIIEAALHKLGCWWDPMRVDHAVQSHERWYKGDGAYGDGNDFHWDYYNSFVIQPMLVDVLDTLPDVPGSAGWSHVRQKILDRFQRAAAVQERLIGADGSFPPIGRSLTYRSGAFQLLAQAALQGRLPETLHPAQVRCALQAVIARTLDASGTYDEAGWLKPGLCGHQPSLMEMYISTGSLYLASTIFLPLGLPCDHPFWQAEDAPWSQVLVWRGDAIPIDGALRQ